MLINIKRKLLTNEADAERGRAIAEWLNRHDPRRVYSPAYGLIANIVVSRSAAVRGGVARQDAFRVVLGVGLESRGLPGEKDRRGGVVRMRVDLEPQDRRVKFRLVPIDEESKWLYTWGELVNSGNAARLMICPNCRKFWYCEGRTDKKACSPGCKVALWQKTPEGREKRAAYMRLYRKQQGERDRKQNLRGNRLKTSKGILAKLGK